MHRPAVESCTRAVVSLGMMLCLAGCGAQSTNVTSPLVSPTASPASVPSTGAAPTATPSASATSAPSPGALGHEDGTPRLSEAFPYLPATTSSLTFMDWAAIKAQLDATGVGSQSPNADRVAFLTKVLTTEAMVTAYGPGLKLQSTTEQWGWDVTDLDWQLDLAVANAKFPALIRRFPAGYDLRPLRALYEKRKYTHEELDAGTLYSVGSTTNLLAEPWIAQSELSVLNTAFLADGHTLVFSQQPDAIREVIAQIGSTGTPAGFLDAVAALDDPWAAVFNIGEGSCRAYDPSQNTFATAAGLATVRADITAAGPLHPYEVLGMGYSRRLSPVGRLAFAYADAATASDDLTGRAQLAAGTNTQGKRHADSDFVAGSSSVIGDVIAIQLVPFDDQPMRLFFPVGSQPDLSAATCSN